MTAKNELIIPDQYNISDYINNQDLSSASMKNYNIGISIFLEWVKNNTNKELKDLSVYDFIAFKRWLSTEDYTNNTKNSYLTGVMSMYKILEKHGFTNICVGIKKFDTSNYSFKDGISIEDWQNMLKLVKTNKFNGKKHYLILYLLYTTGVRQMSLRNLKWKNFGYNANVKSMVMDIKLKGHGNRSGTVLLNEQAVKLVQEFQYAYNLHYCMDETGLISEINTDWYVFGNKDKMLSDRGIRAITERYLKEANIYRKGEITGHSFRHGIAEWLIDNTELGLSGVQQFLCHQSQSSTKIYAGKREKIRVDKNILEQINKINLSDFR